MIIEISNLMLNTKKECPTQCNNRLLKAVTINLFILSSKLFDGKYRFERKVKQEIHLEKKKDREWGEKKGKERINERKYKKKREREAKRREREHCQ